MLLGLANNPRQIDATLAAIFKTPENHQVMLEVLTRLNPAEKYSGCEWVALKVIEGLLKQHEDGTLSLVVSTTEHIRAIAMARQLNFAAVMLFESLTEHDACKLLAADIEVLSLLNLAIGNAREADATSCVSTLARCAAHSDYELNAQLIALAVPASVISALATNLGAGESFVSNALYLLSALATTHGVETMGLAREASNVLQVCLTSHASSEYIQNLGSAFWEKLSEAFLGCREQLLEEKMMAIGTVHEPAQDWQEVLSAESQVYYFNQRTLESVWDMPPEYAAFDLALEKIDEVRAVRGLRGRRLILIARAFLRVQLVTLLEGDMTLVDVNAVLYLCPIAATHTRDARVLFRIVRPLAGILKVASAEYATVDSEDFASASALMTSAQRAMCAGEFRCGKLAQRTELLYLIPAMEARFGFFALAFEDDRIRDGAGE